MLILLAQGGIILLTFFYILWLIGEFREDAQREKLEEESRTTIPEGGSVTIPIPVRKRFNGLSWRIHLGIGLGIPGLGILWGLVLTI